MLSELHMLLLFGCHSLVLVYFYAFFVVVFFFVDVCVL